MPNESRRANIVVVGAWSVWISLVGWGGVILANNGATVCTFFFPGSSSFNSFISSPIPADHSFFCQRPFDQTRHWMSAVANMRVVVLVVLRLVGFFLSGHTGER